MSAVLEHSADPAGHVLQAERRPVLQFSRSRLTGGGFARTGGMSLNLAIRQGELCLIQLHSVQRAADFSQACVGLMPPVSGSVRFYGHEWSEMAPSVAQRVRGRIGQMFNRGGWLPDLSVLENVLLPMLHHTRSSLDSLRSDAAALARGFAMPGIPLGYPSEYGEEVLRRAACVRAFLGEPLMVVLQVPTRGVYSRILPGLINAAREARNRGAAVIWLTAEREVWRDMTIPASSCYRMTDRDVIPVVRRQ